MEKKKRDPCYPKEHYRVLTILEGEFYYLHDVDGRETVGTAHDTYFYTHKDKFTVLDTIDINDVPKERLIETIDDGCDSFDLNQVLDWWLEKPGTMGGEIKRIAEELESKK